MRVSTVVENVLIQDEASRNSDKRLQLIVWHKMGLVLTPEQRDKFMDMPSSETIRRVRQKLQEQGKYKANEAVTKERLIKSLMMQQQAPTIKVENVEHLTQGRLV